jgi:hypothetical protein
MVHEVPPRRAVDTAWSVYRAVHIGVDAADSRLACWSVICKGDGRRANAMSKNLQASDSLTSRDFPRIRMLRRVEGSVGRVATESTRPDWTMFAISQFLSGAIVLVLRSIFGA